uniref:4-diphosphocytidyl-2C-methyl-D-erythritol cytidylyltransferase n=1 Tax=Babesia orientalis TaxID=273649 RepID=A0A346CI69_9APIC|nr:4-diphosphocytidyl-2C-methyl-D-erythritol cytidylyltransferase [Babesia orientalis]
MSVWLVQCVLICVCWQLVQAFSGHMTSYISHLPNYGNKTSAFSRIHFPREGRNYAINGSCTSGCHPHPGSTRHKSECCELASSKSFAKAILVCGGVGTRLNGQLERLRGSGNKDITLLEGCPVSKQFVLIQGIPVFIYSFAELVRSPLLSEVVIGTKPEWNMKILELVDTYTQRVPQYGTLSSDDPDTPIINPLQQDYIIHVNGADDAGYIIPRDQIPYPVDSARLQEYETHLETFSYFVYDLEEQRCLLSSSPSWADAVLSAIRDGPHPRYKIVTLSPSGETRAMTVYNALMHEKSVDLYLRSCCRTEYFALVHDSARPLVRRIDVKKLLSKAAEFGAAIPAVNISDTIKVGKSEGVQTIVSNTLDRSSLYAIQTPQAFCSSLLKRAYDSAFETGSMAHLTDDSSFVEQLGTERVALVPGHRMNIKLTTWEDLAVCNSYLKEVYFP